MSSLSDRNRELLIARIQADPRMEDATVQAATALMRVSIFATVAYAVAGAILAQVVFGEGTVQFAVGMGAGYIGYFIYLFATMKPPRVLGVMAALTDDRVILLGSRKVGIVAEYGFKDLRNLEMARKGNLLLMGKMAITPLNGETLTFLTTNRRQAADFVEKFHTLRGPLPS